MRKSLFLLLLLLLSFCNSKAQNYTPINLTGFNEDVIAENINSLLETTNGMDIQNNLIYSQTFGANNSIGAGIVNSRIINSTNRTYQLQPYTVLNGLHVIQSGSQQTLILSTPKKYSKLSVLALSTEGNCTLTVNLYFAGSSTPTSFTNFNLLDWVTGVTGNVYGGYGRTQRVASGYTNGAAAAAPYLYPIDIYLSCTDKIRTLDSIGFIVTSGVNASSRAYIFAVSGVPYALNYSTAITKVGCSGGSTGSITLNVTGSDKPYTVTAWNTTPVQTGNTASNLATGNYVATISDSLGCINHDTITVGQTTSPVIVLKAIPDTVCNGGSTTLSVSGLATRTWSPTGLTIPTIVVSPTTTGYYHVSGNGINGCPGGDSIKVYVVPNLILHVNPNSAAICKGTNVQLNATAAHVYSWTPALGLSSTTISSPVANPTVNSTYYLTATDTNGCVGKDSVHITVYNLPVVTASVSPTTICSGDTASLTTTGLTTFVWSPNGSNKSPAKVFPTTTTTYTVSGIDAHACNGQASVTLNVLAAPNLTVTPTSTSICFGSNTSLTASGGANYTWSPSAGLSSTNQAGITASPTITTTYTVTSTNAASGCTRTKQAVVIVNPLPVITVTATPPTICLGNSSQLSVTNLTNFVWSPGGQTTSPATVSPTVNTTYTVSGTDANGCIGIGSTSVTVNQFVPTINVSANDTTVCQDGVVYLTANGGAASYTWQPTGQSGSSIQAFPSAQTTYTATGLFPGPCYVTASLTINTVPRSIANFNAFPTTGCSPLLVKFINGSSNANSFQWRFSDGTSYKVSNVNHVFKTGTWDATLIATNSFGCADTLSLPKLITATANPQANFNFSPLLNTPISLNNATFQFTNLSNGAINYTWNFGDNTSSALINPSHTYTAPGSYYVTLIATNAAGCIDSSVYGIIEVLATENVTLPSAFSPNGDHINDNFNVVFSPFIQTMDLKIYNRWGELMFETTDLKTSWDGTYKGQQQPAGTYVYSVDATFTDGKTISKQGNVTLLR